MFADRFVYPPLIRSYILRALLFWAVVRFAILFVGLTQLDTFPGLFAASIASGLSWFDHTRSGENFLHASLGGRIGAALATTVLVIFALELIVP